ncbi:zinc-binding metallopeptidase family protein [Chelatococcus reniformis]|uniref:Zinc-ribbon domain-containing protein n=1 Tax=Chelatococcus reniformis TaxID=1494448 RepID=A0A916UAN9_9HYPH|nr:putative zinc-binding peptidase [Chelatococcus reniformis]GGC66754.1 hypothetical protein GCM10010994_26670 [Chelatococcus reniformis]
MKLFQCQHCGQPLYFENSACESCGRSLGYVAALGELSALEPTGQSWAALAEPSRPYRFCANAVHASCNWLVPADGADDYCTACRHNRTIPDLSGAINLERWRRIEIAKHRLFYTLLRLGLPLRTRAESAEGLAFDFLADPSEPSLPTILTGHDKGLITINLAEADDVERERRRHDMGEAYRTLLGHFRHEVGHYFWDRLVADGGSLAPFREVFGDERDDYGEALKRHYASGAPADWRERFVTPYASSHPWEDFAETWAHYLHIVDTLETAGAFGLKVKPSVPSAPDLMASVDFDPHEAIDMERLIAAWLPLTFAVNSLNRSMGQPDLYPFVLSPAVIVKVSFVHDIVHQVTGRAVAQRTGSEALKAVIAGLRNHYAAPPRR